MIAVSKFTTAVIISLQNALEFTNVSLLYGGGIHLDSVALGLTC